MSVFIALYRGINVGGNKSVKMELLRAMHERIGHRDVKNYIQSGNIVFAATGTATAVARKISTEFIREFGFDSKVLVVDAKRWARIVKGNPYAKFAAKDPKTVHVGFCDGKPSAKGLNDLLEKVGKREKFTIEKDVVYLHSPDGYGTSKFAAGMEKASGVPMTVRNWRTVEALSTMVSEVNS